MSQSKTNLLNKVYSNLLAEVAIVTVPNYRGLPVYASAEELGLTERDIISLANDEHIELPAHLANIDTDILINACKKAAFTDGNFDRVAGVRSYLLSRIIGRCRVLKVDVECAPKIMELVPNCTCISDDIIDGYIRGYVSYQ